METKFTTLIELKEGSFVMIDGIPCKVASVTKSKPGKHGAAKIRLEALGLADNRRRSIVSSTADRVEVPIIDKRNAQVISISGNKANVMDTESYETFEIDIPEDLKDKVIEGATVMYWDVGVKQIKGVK
jgi:translation initiation factor 5A